MKRKNGFTIVETTLVLAIAGLIFLLAFVALPALSRSQRDSQRRTDVMNLADSIKKYQSNNNRGSLPKDTAELNSVVNSFMGDFYDPDGIKYTVVLTNCKNNTAVDVECPGITVNDHEIHLVPSATCSDKNNAKKSSNPRKAVLLTKLEVNDVFCYEF